MKTKKFFPLLVSGIIVGSLLCSSANAYSGIYNMTYMYPGINAVSYVDTTQDSLSVVALHYFGVSKNDDGSVHLDVSSTLNSSFIADMHSRGVKVVPYIATRWSDQNMAVFAMDQREKLTTDIAAAVTQYNLDGINVDIENLPASSRDAQTDFMRLLRSKIPANKEVSVAVAANPNGYTTGWNGSYDYANLSKYCTYLMVMAYDQHSNGSPEGPVAGFPWVESTIKGAINQGVPASKIVLGVPFYARYWKTDGSVNGAAVTMKTMKAWIDHYKPTVSFDALQQTANAVLTVSSGDTFSSLLTPGTYHIWYENEASLKAKLALVDRYQLKGAGTWALSQETPEVWNYYKGYLNIIHYLVYQYSTKLGEYTNLNEATNLAKMYDHASVYNVKTKQTQWENYPKIDKYNSVTISKSVTMYTAPSKTSKVLGSVDAQKLSSFAYKEFDGGWYQIGTWLGPAWINPGPAAFVSPVPENKHWISLLVAATLYNTPFESAKTTLSPGVFLLLRTYGSWIQISTSSGEKWISSNQILKGVNPNPGYLMLLENTKVYNTPLDSEIISTLKPATVSYTQSWYGWYRINTYLGYKWIKPSKALSNLSYTKGTLTLYSNTSLYNLPLDAKSVAIVKPTTVSYISSSSGWYLVKTYLGYRWMKPSNALTNVSKKTGKLMLLENTQLFNLPFDAKGVSAVKPTFVSYIESSSGWYRVQTYLGYKWIKPGKFHLISN